MENKQTSGVSPTFVQTQSWLTDLMARSAEDSTSSKHPAFTRGPTYRFPVPTIRHISDHVGIASLVGGSATPLKNRTSSIGMMTWPQYFWENAKFMATIHHQPVQYDRTQLLLRCKWSNCIPRVSHYRIGQDWYIAAVDKPTSRQADSPAPGVLWITGTFHIFVMGLFVG